MEEEKKSESTLIVDRIGNELKIGLDGSISVNQSKKDPWNVNISSDQYREILRRFQLLHDQLRTQVRGLFDEHGNAIDSTSNFGQRHLLVSSIPQNNIYTNEGRHFSATLSNFVLPKHGHHILLIANPANSNKTLLLTKAIYFGRTTSAEQIIFRWISSPTINNVGHGIEKFNHKVGTVIDSPIKIFSSPSLSGGTFFHETIYFSGTPPIYEDWDLVLPENNTIALMGIPNGINTPITVSLHWMEV